MPAVPAKFAVSMRPEASESSSRQSTTSALQRPIISHPPVPESASTRLAVDNARTDWGHDATVANPHGKPVEF